MKERPEYLKIANEYCQSVLSGEVPACRWVKLACHPINSITPFMFALDRTHLFGQNLIV